MSDLFKKYNQSMHNRLRFPFEGSEALDIMHSQAYQDVFTLAMFNGKKNGTYLEIGGYLPYYGNNTALLEEKFGWSGVSVEIVQEYANIYQAARPRTQVICANALYLDYAAIASQIAVDNKIDYLQLDCEPPGVTFQVLEKMPLTEYKFGVITYEHDYYVDETKSYRAKSRELLESHGYELIVGNVSINGHVTYEDWWAHPDVVGVEAINRMQCPDAPANLIDNYMFID
jgi:hypothetical protein